METSERGVAADRNGTEAADPSPPVGGAAAGFLLLFEGLRLVRQRELRGLAVVPLGFSMVFVTLALTLLWGYAPEVHGFLTAWMPVLEPGAWYTWIWIGPAKLVFTVVGWLLFLGAIGGSVIAAGLVASVTAAPFLDALSQRVERIERGEVIEAESLGLAGLTGELRRTVIGELQRVVFFVGLWATIFTLGVVIPGAQLLAPPLLVALTVFFLPLDYAGHLLDRRQLPFRARRVWLRDRWPALAGFGSAAFLTCLIPGLNFLLLPALVAAGTLLALRHPPKELAG